MTFATEKLKAGRRKFEVVELDLDACSLVYSIAPCAAAFGVGVYDGAPDDLDVSGQDSQPLGVSISSDGLHLAVAGDTNAKIYFYTFGVAHDGSTLTYDGAPDDLDVSGQDSIPTGVAISSDGLHLAVSGGSNNKVYFYTFGVAHDGSTLTYDALNDLDVSGQDSQPVGVAVSSDGFHLYVAGRTNKKIYVYTFGIEYKGSTLTYDGADSDLDVSGEDSDPQDVAISADGKFIYVVGFNTDAVYTYELRAAHNLRTASYRGSVYDLDVSDQDSVPTGVTVSSDRRHFFVSGNTNNKVYAYSAFTDLAKCFNTFATCQDTVNFTLETKTFRFCTPIAGISRAYDAIPSIQAISTTPTKLDPGRSVGKRAKITITLQDHPHHDRGVDKYALERPDGTAGTPAYTPAEQGSFFGKLYARNPHYVGRTMRLMTGFLPWDHDEDPDNQASASEATVEANLDTRTYVIDQWNGPDASGRFTVIAKDLLKLAEDSRAECPVRNTGVLDAGINDTVLNITTTTFDGGAADLDLSGLGTDVRTMAIDFGTGTHLFVYSRNAGVSELRSYDLGTPFDLSTAVINTTVDISADFAFEIFGLAISDDGLRLVIRQSVNVLSYIMTVPFDLTTRSINITVGIGAPTPGAGVAFSNNGRKVYFPTNSLIAQANLSSPWNIFVASFPGTFTPGSEIAGTVSGVAVSEDGSRLYLVDDADDKIHFYTMLSPGTVSSAVYDGVANEYDLNAEDTVPGPGLFAHSGDRLAFAGRTNQTLYSYTLTQAGAATLSPAGVGDLEYEAAGTVRIGDELIPFSRDGDDLLLTARGAFDTTAATHDAGDLVQQAKHFSEVRVDFIIQDLLENFAGIDPSFIPIADWNVEIAAFLPTFILSTIISEPVGVTSLINELSQQCLVLLRWDELDQEFNLTALRSALPELVVTDANTIQGTLRQVDSPKDRLTRVTILYGRLNSLVRLDDRTGFIFSHTSADSAAETGDEFGDIRNLNLNSRWFSSGQDSVVRSAADGILARYVDTPAVFQFSLDVKDATIWTGSIIEIQSRYRQDTFGAVGSQIAQVIEARELPNGNFAYKAISI